MKLRHFSKESTHYSRVMDELGLRTIGSQNSRTSEDLSCLAREQECKNVVVLSCEATGAPLILIYWIGEATALAQHPCTAERTRRKGANRVSKICSRAVAAVSTKSACRRLQRRAFCSEGRIPRYRRQPVRDRPHSGAVRGHLQDLDRWKNRRDCRSAARSFQGRANVGQQPINSRLHR